MKLHLIAVITVAVFLSGCTDAQINRAEAIADRASAEVARVQVIVDEATKLADALGIEKAQPIIDQANDALVAAKATAKAAQDTADAAKAAHDAGGSTISTLFAGLLVLVTGVSAATPAIIKAVNTARALRQTVAGIEKAKESMNEADVVLLHNKLRESMDESSKTLVKKAKV